MNDLQIIFTTEFHGVWSRSFTEFPLLSATLWSPSAQLCG